MRQPKNLPGFGPFQTALRARLRSVADPARAPKMQAYMKSTMPFWGVPMPLLRKEVRALAASVPFSSQEHFEAFVRALFEGATHHEERSAALMLLDLKHTRAFRTWAAVGLYEWLIVQGAWWDLVDEVATHCFLPLFERDEAAVGALLRRWSRGSNLWLRRTAIIAQVLRHEETDLALLFDAIAPAIDDTEFFLRKAIGWALRSAAPDFPKQVRAFLTAHQARLSGLSRREAEKGFL